MSTDYDDTFPDVGSMSDEELKELINELTEEEREVSYRRRTLHGKIDILRAELVNRLKIPPLILTFGMLSVLQGVIFTLTDRSIVLHTGARVADGEPAEVIASPVVQEAYLGLEAARD